MARLGEFLHFSRNVATDIFANELGLPGSYPYFIKGLIDPKIKMLS